MNEKEENEKKFCGNCTSHNAYSYPGRVFCTKRFLKHNDAIVQTLWCCEEWSPNLQQCHCVHDATKEQK
jgi:hypothetical protein